MFELWDMQPEASGLQNKPYTLNPAVKRERALD
jgi:hypothetical protein